jgi:hypothetical protein
MMFICCDYNWFVCVSILYPFDRYLVILLCVDELHSGKDLVDCFFVVLFCPL